jgi:hypothetical protein
MNRWLKGVLLVVAFAVVVVVLFTTVFPWFDRTFVNDPVMGAVPAAHAG